MENVIKIVTEQQTFKEENKMKKILSILLVICIVLSLFVGCAGKETEKKDNKNNVQNEDQSQSNDSSDDTGNDKKTFAVIVHSTQSTYWQTLNSGAEKAGEENNIDIFFTAAPGGGADINGQADIIEQTINQKVDGILLAASDTKALVPAAEKAVNAGIPLVLIDCGLDTEMYSSFIATDNVGASSMVAEAIAEKIGEEGKVAVLNFAPGMLTGALREQGFRDTMADKYPNITLLETQYYNNDVQKALEITQNILTANSDLKAIYATNEFGIVGASRALMEKENKSVPVYGFDFSSDVTPLIDDGYCQGTIVQKPFDMGYLGVLALLDVIDGKEVEKNIDSGAVLVTPENFNDEESQRVLYPENYN